ncbi:MAG: AmmeMemoRadiSam system radical SAM enzyme [Candidatus Latescibacteria bacterium]|nr:AmmeMemoRadiSam system radical SAM enzyme [Candidatus Latescibacterota bacterium]
MGSEISRRRFLRDIAEKGASLALVSQIMDMVRPFGQAEASSEVVDHKHIFVSKEAMHYVKLGRRAVRCELCPWSCTVGEGQKGLCKVRKNVDGTYYTLVYANPCAVHVDPIEKKPFFHFLPGTGAFSIATAGCNIECKFCQNWDISQVGPERLRNLYLPPERTAQLAHQAGVKSIAYTYSEPVVFYEYVLDTSIAAKELGLKNVVVSNGFINPKPMEQWCKYLDAVKIDLKAYSDNYYERICSARLQPVLDTLKLLKQLGMWFEIVYLVVPTENDSDDEFKGVCNWIAENLGTDVPLHFSRFYPAYKMRNYPPTPVKTLERARRIARETGLNYVYIGNVAGSEAENTRCPKCGKVVVRRRGYSVLEVNLKEGKCGFCGCRIPGVWS